MRERIVADALIANQLHVFGLVKTSGTDEAQVIPKVAPGLVSPGLALRPGLVPCHHVARRGVQE